MSIEAGHFPYREISSSEFNLLKSIVGIPDPVPQQIGEFLNCARPLLHANTRLLRVLHATWALAVEEVGAQEDRAAPLLFTTGALLYASVFQYVNQETRLPVKDETLEQLERAEVRDVMFESKRAIANVPRFPVVLERVLSTLPQGKELSSIGYIGAGTVHLALLDIRAQESPDVHSFVLSTDERRAATRMFDALEADPFFKRLSSEFDTPPRDGGL